MGGRTLLAEDVPLPEADAYRVQDLLTARRLAAGERIIGWKLGYTTVAMREALGIDRPNHGPLTDAMVMTSPADAGSGLLQPRVEPEIAVRVRPDGVVVSRHLALEVVDSVWEGYRFTWAHNTADGSSAALAVLSDLPLSGDLSGTEVVLSTSAGEEARTVIDPSLLDPDASAAWLMADLARRHVPVPDVTLVLTGGLVPPLSLPPDGWAEAQLAGTTARICWRMTP